MAAIFLIHLMAYSGAHTSTYNTAHNSTGNTVLFMHHGSGTGAGYTTNYSTFGSFAPALFAFCCITRFGSYRAGTAYCGVTLGCSLLFYNIFFC